VTLAPRIGAAGILGMLLLAMPPLAADGGKRLALVIGVDEYASLSPLRGAALDAARIAQWLSHSGYDEVRLITSSSSTGGTPVAADVLAAMASMRGAVRGKAVDEISFFFSGHGFGLGGSERLCLSDAVVGSAQGSVGLYEDVLPWMRTFNSRLCVAMVDACREEAAISVAAPLPRNDSPLATKSSMLVLQAAAPGSLSREMASGDGGYFTQSLIDAFVQTDGSLGSLVDFLARNLPARTLADSGYSQVPGIAGDFDPSLDFSAIHPTSIAAAKDLGELIVTSRPSGAQVWCGSRYLGVTPLIWAEAVPGNIRLTAKLKGLSAEQSVDIAPGTMTSTELKLSEALGRVFFGTDRKLLEFSVDGAPFRPMNGQAWIEVPPGRRSIRVLAESSLYWEGNLEVASDRTIQVVPDFVPSGRITIKLPKGAILYLRSAEGSRDYLFTESGSLDALPIGKYHAETGDDRYMRWQGDFTLTPGGDVRLSPSLVPTELGKRLFEIETLERNLPREQMIRSACDVAAWSAIGASIVLGVVGSFAFSEWTEASRAYSEAGLGADFKSLRASVGETKTKMVVLFSASAITGLTGSLLLPLGPNPEASSHRLDLLKAEVGKAADLP